MLTTYTPIRPIEGHPYWVLSIEHLSDVANLLIFVAPASIVAFFAYLFWRDKGVVSRDKGFVILGMTAWAAFLVSFWIDPKLGAPRDWDLLSFYGMPLSLASSYLITIQTDKYQNRNLVLIQAVMLAGFLLLPNVYEKSYPAIALARIEPLTWNDPHYQESYKQAYGCIAWGAILHHQCGRSDLAEKCFKRRISASPDCKYAWYNMGIVAFDRQRYESAVDYFARALQLNPGSEQYAKSLQAAQVQNLRFRGR